jgi:hypothetical protein
MGFLRKAGNYNLQEALAICDKKQLYRATVFLYGISFCFLYFVWKYLLLGRAGNGRVALQIILEKLNDIEEAINFCRETGDKKLWAELIEKSVNKPGKGFYKKEYRRKWFVFIEEFIRGLLNHAGSDVDLQKLIETIRGDLRIPGLRDSLCKIMQDYNIQVIYIEDFYQT